MSPGRQGSPGSSTEQDSHKQLFNLSPKLSKQAKLTSSIRHAVGTDGGAQVSDVSAEQCDSGAPVATPPGAIAASSPTGPVPAHNPAGPAHSVAPVPAGAAAMAGTAVEAGPMRTATTAGIESHAALERELTAAAQGAAGAAGMGVPGGQLLARAIADGAAPPCGAAAVPDCIMPALPLGAADVPRTLLGRRGEPAPAFAPFQVSDGELHSCGAVRSWRPFTMGRASGAPRVGVPGTTALYKHEEPRRNAWGCCMRLPQEALPWVREY